MEIFTRLAAPHIGDGLGGLVVESTAAATIAAYLVGLRLTGSRTQSADRTGVFYSILTGVCVGAGTILSFLLFQKGGPLSAVPAILAVGATVMALAGIIAFREPASPKRLLGMALSIFGLYLLRRT